MPVSGVQHSADNTLKDSYVLHRKKNGFTL